MAHTEQSSNYSAVDDVQVGKGSRLICLIYSDYENEEFSHIAKQPALYRRCRALQDGVMLAQENQHMKED